MHSPSIQETFYSQFLIYMPLSYYNTYNIVKYSITYHCLMGKCILMVYTCNNINYACGNICFFGRLPCLHHVEFEYKLVMKLHVLL